MRTSVSSILGRTPRSRSVPSTSLATGCPWQGVERLARYHLRYGRDVAEPKNRGQGATENGQQGQDDLVYAARISLDQRQLKTEDRVVDLGPGMAVTAEVKTGSRRIIGYLLSPLARYEHEALRKR